LIGITTGSVYALIALGYTLVYGILQLINFAHGDVFALTGLVSSTFLVSLFGLDETSSLLAILAGLLATLVIVVAFGALLNATIEFVAYRRLRQAPRLAVLITAVGMSFIVQNVSLAIFGVNFRSIPPLISEGKVFKIGDVS
jgi:branched-chain amino acid transport system permease protein